MPPVDDVRARVESVAGGLCVRDPHIFTSGHAGILARPTPAYRTGCTTGHAGGFPPPSPALSLRPPAVQDLQTQLKLATECDSFPIAAVGTTQHPGRRCPNRVRGGNADCLLTRARSEHKLSPSSRHPSAPCERWTQRANRTVPRSWRRAASW